MRRGDVRWSTLRSPDKRRPVLVLTRSSALPYLTNVTVAPLTTTVRNIPTEVLLSPEEDGLPQRCAVNLDNIQTIAQDAVGALIVQLSSERMQEVERAIQFALGIEHPRSRR